MSGKRGIAGVMARAGLVLRWIRKRLRQLLAGTTRVAHRSWPMGCLTTGTFTPPDNILGPAPPRTDWTGVPSLLQEFRGPQVGGRPNSGPTPPQDPRSKHVDRSHHAAANVPGGGTHNSPWASIQYAIDQLKSGETVYVHKPSDPNPAQDGLYIENLDITGRQGSSAQPFWVIADPGVRLKDPKSSTPGLRVEDSAYWVLQGFELDGGGVAARTDPMTGAIGLAAGVAVARCTAIALHGLYVHAWTRAGVSLVGSDGCIVSACRVEDNVQKAGEDCHGMQVLWDCKNTLVYANTTRGNAGDGIQLQQGQEDSQLPGQTEQQPPGQKPQNTTILKNHFAGDGENGVDLKNCELVGVQQNSFEQYLGPQAAIVVHCRADEIVIERNDIRNCGQAMTVGAWNGRVGKLSFRFNQVFNLARTAVRVSHTKRAEIYHNTIVNLPKTGTPLPAGIVLADWAIMYTPMDRKAADAAVDTAAVFNNIVVTSAYGVNYVLPSPGAVGVLELLSDYNVLHDCTHAIVAAYNPQVPGWVHNGRRYDCSTNTSDPGLRWIRGQYMPTTAVAVDKAALLSNRPIWQRICRNGPDIGAVEACP
jgi:hypothetical protein